MNENIKVFLEKMAADSELQARFSQIKDPDEAYELASSIQSGFTKEEFVTETTKITAASTSFCSLFRTVRMSHVKRVPKSAITLQ